MLKLKPSELQTRRIQNGVNISVYSFSRCKNEAQSRNSENIVYAFPKEIGMK